MNTALEIDAEPGDEVSKISDTDSIFSNIKAQLSDFHKCLQDLKQHSRKEAKKYTPIYSRTLCTIWHGWPPGSDVTGQKFHQNHRLWSLTHEQTPPQIGRGGVV